MSPAALRALFGSCLSLGILDMAWLDLNAGRLSEEPPSPATVLVAPAAAPSEPALPVARAAPAPTAPPARVLEAAEVPEPPPKPEERATSCVIQFERSASVIPVDQVVALAAIAETVKKEPRAVVRIGGHADRVAWKGNRGDNMTLSENRALAVAAALQKLGVASDRIRRAAFGDKRPVDDRATEDAHRRNRRVEVRVELRGDR